jgi:hypothetical protein
MSPTERSLKLLRKEGWRVAVVEKWNPHAKVRQDLFGFADLIAFGAPGIVTLVQVTSYSNMSSRRAKIRANEIADAWLLSYRIELHGWKKVGKAWMLKREVL